MGEKADLINRIKNFKEMLSEEKIVDMKFEDRLSDAYEERISEGYREVIKEYSMLIRELFDEVNRLVTLIGGFLKGLGEREKK